MRSGRGSFTRLFHQHKRTTRIAHITDTEGSNYFIEAVKRNKILSFSPDKGLDFNQTGATPCFIYGGDATDRGPHDLETVEMLVDFKKRYPGNVALLVGNREVKNNRFKIELAPQLIHDRLLHSNAARWLPAHAQITPFNYLKSIIACHDDATVHDYIKSLSVEDAQFIYLTWMLENNMGCQNTFAYRRQELQRRTQDTLVTDRDVLKSFIETTSPAGVMGEYLALGQMGVIVPHTRVMAVHGGLTPFNIGRVPEDKAFYPNAENWMNKLNLWYSKQIQAWADGTPGTATDPASSSLDEAVLPIPNKAKQIVTADMLSHERMFASVSNQVSDYLIANQISIVLTGHQPCGDHPAILRNQEDNVVFINADTSYAAFNPKELRDTRGVAQHSLEIFSDNGIASVNINAITSRGQQAETKLIVSADMILGDPYIGKLLNDGSLVQCRLEAGEYRLVKQKGFEVNYRKINAADLDALMEMEARPQFTLS